MVLNQLHLDDLDVIKRALEQYKANLELINSEDEIETSELFKQEFTDLIEDVDELIKAMIKGNDRFTLVSSHGSFVKNALTSYKKYLVETKKCIYDKLGAEPEFKSIDDDITAIPDIIPKLS